MLGWQVNLEGPWVTAGKKFKPTLDPAHFRSPNLQTRGWKNRPALPPSDLAPAGLRSKPVRLLLLCDALTRTCTCDPKQPPESGFFQDKKKRERDTLVLSFNF
jgi:hypothetical protein